MNRQECWDSLNNPDTKGYFSVYLNGKNQRAHRVAYELFYGEKIPDGMTIDHLCRNRACVNPFHLEVVTNKVNVLRGEGLTAQNARKTHCIHGHSFDKKNTRMRSTGGRACRACVREEWRRRNKP